MSHVWRIGGAGACGCRGTRLRSDWAMDRVRRVAALLIAVSLVLPQRSCVNDGHVQIDYPLSNAQGWLSVVMIAAFFVLPLALLFLRRARIAAAIAGLMVALAGLYYVSYAATILATRMLVGWYAYTVGTVVYALASLWMLTQWLRRRDGPA